MNTTQKQPVKCPPQVVVKNPIVLARIQEAYDRGFGRNFAEAAGNLIVEGAAALAAKQASASSAR